MVQELPAFVLLGEPGAGKTSVLHRLVLKAAHEYQDLENAPVPLLVDLVAWDERLDFQEFVRQQWPLTSDAIALIESGGIILCLDSLNEIQGARNDKIQQIRRWLDSRTPPQRLIVTCRSADYGPEVDLGLPIVQIGKMDRQHIEQFVTYYLGEEIAPILISQIVPARSWDEQHKHYLYQIARNPFFLSAMILAHKSSPYGDVPETLGMLMHRAVIEMWERESSKHQGNPVTFEELVTALSDFAYILTEHELGPYVPYAYALEYIGSQLLLDSALTMNFVEICAGHVRFAYEPLKDYFAALALARVDLSDKLTPPEITRSGEYVPARWDNAFLMLSSQVHDPDTFLLDMARINPFLALECIASGVNISAQLVEPILGELIQVANISQQDARVATAAILARISTDLALPVLLEAMRVGRWHVRQAAALALWEIEIPTLEGLSGILEELEDDIQDATNTAVRHLGANALPTLLKLLHDESWKTRRSAAWALGYIKDRAAVPGLVHTLFDDDNLVSAEAARTLGKIKDAAAVPRLLETLRHSNWRVRKAAARALGAIGTPALHFLVAVLHDKEEDVRRLAVHALKTIEDPKVAPALLDASHDACAEVRGAAVDAMQGREDGNVAKRLVECLTDTEIARWNRQRICDMAASILIQMNTSQILAAIEQWHQEQPVVYSDEAQDMQSRSRTSKNIAKQRLKNLTRPVDNGSSSAPVDRDEGDMPLEAVFDGDWETRRDAVRALVSSESSAVAILLLMRALEDPHIEVRLAAVDGLAAIQEDAALNALLRGLKDGEQAVIDKITQHAQRIGAGKAVPALLMLLDHQEPVLRARSAGLLGDFKANQSVSALNKRLEDTAQPEQLDQRVCDYAAEALQAIGSDESLAALKSWKAPKKPPRRTQPRRKRLRPRRQRKEILGELLESLQQADWGQRENAAKALREYARTLHGVRDPHIVKQLENALKDENWIVRWAAAEALSWIGDPDAVPALITQMTDKNWTVRVAAIRALLEIGDRSATEPVLAALDDQHNAVREAAAEALGALGGWKSIRALTKALNDDEHLVRLAAAQSLGRIGSKGTIRPLLKALNDVHPHVRWAAAGVFSQVKAEEAIPLLIEKLDDNTGPYWEDLKVCDLAAEALVQMSTPEATRAVESWRAQHVARA